MPTGKEKRVPVDSENIRPRLSALPGRAKAAEHPEDGSPRSRQGGGHRRRRKPQGRVEGYRRDGPRPDRRRPKASTPTSTSRSGRPAAALRGSTRSRSSTAGSCSKRRRSTGPTARTPSPPTSAAPASCCCSKEALQQRVLADPNLDIYECGRNDIATGQIDRRVLARARVPGLQRLQADDHLAQVRPQLPELLRLRLRALDRRRGRHRRHRRRPGHRPPGPGDARPTS